MRFPAIEWDLTTSRVLTMELLAGMRVDDVAALDAAGMAMALARQDADALPPCPACGEDCTYESGGLLTCPMCGHGWTRAAAGGRGRDGRPGARRRRAPLEDGCDVTVAKDLKVKGGATIKSGTKVRGIRLLESPVDGHDISAKVPGQGQMYLKSSVVKRA